MFQMANVGPLLGQAHHFRGKAPHIEYGVKRYTDEATRLWKVMDGRLGEAPHLAGNDYTIADMATYVWLRNPKGQGQNLDDFKYFKRWFEELSARPALQKGMAVTAGEPPEDPATLSNEEKERRAKLLYNQRARPAPAS